MKRKYVRGSGRQATPTERADLLAERAAGAPTTHDLAVVARSLRNSELPPAENGRVERALFDRAVGLR